MRDKFPESDSPSPAGHGPATSPRKRGEVEKPWRTGRFYTSLRASGERSPRNAAGEGFFPLRVGYFTANAYVDRGKWTVDSGLDAKPSQRREQRTQPHRGLRLGLLFLLSAVHCSFCAGCKPNKRYDLIEAELRTRERELEDTRAALEQSRNLNRAYAQQSPGAVPPPGTPAYIPVKEITLGRGTGGVDEDGVPGDDGLMVVVIPKDEDGSPVKVPAQVQIAAWEVTPAGLKRQIGNWTVPPEKVRPTWRSGLISTGYFVPIAWQTYPSTERVRILVRLTTLDGRAFETDKDVIVKLCQTPRVAPPVGPVTPSTPGGREPLHPDPAPPTGVPPGVEELPPPGRGARLLPPEK